MNCMTGLSTHIPIQINHQNINFYKRRNPLPSFPVLLEGNAVPGRQKRQPGPLRAAVPGATTPGNFGAKQKRRSEPCCGRGKMNIQEYFARISYNESHKDADLQTLTLIFQHHIRAIPFENLSMHCGETIKLDLQSVYNKIVRKKRGGWCLETNYLLFWALQELGYDVCILGGKSYEPAEKTYKAGINHILLKVVIKGNSYIADAGFGGPYQAWQPLMLISGKDQPQIPGIFRFTEDNGTWYFEKVKRKHYIPEPSVPLTDTPELGNIRKIYTFTLEPRDINDFQELNTYLQVTPDNLLQKKSICTLQTAEGLYALVGWTFTETKYKYTEDLDLVQFTTLTDEEVEKTLKDKFNIVLENKLVPINVRGLPPNIVDMI